MTVETRPATKAEFDRAYEAIPRYKIKARRPEWEMINSLAMGEVRRIVAHTHNGKNATLYACALSQSLSSWAQKLGRTFRQAHDGADMLIWRVK